MSKQHHDDEDALGSDSFLDIASNIVGILIILVLVAATRMRGYVDEAIREAASEDEPVAAQVENIGEQRQTAHQLVGEVGKLTGEAAKLGQEVQAAKYAREKIAAMIALAERELEKHREKLDEGEKRRHDVAAKLVSARRRLYESEREQLSLVSTPAPQVTVKSYPSAISKTVFTKEEHFRLLGGKIVRVPFTELKDRLFDEKRQLIWKLEDSPEVSGSLGPQDGFRLDYHIARTTVGANLVAAYFIPVQADMGEPLAEALANGSAFRAAIDGLDRPNTTITVWTYPDSFDEFRQLKKELYQMGFGVAGRPLQRDTHIGFSPNGSKSAAQ